MQRPDIMARQVVRRTDFIADRAQEHFKEHGLESTKKYLKHFWGFGWATNDQFYGDSFWVGAKLNSVFPYPYHMKMVREGLWGVFASNYENREGKEYTAYFLSAEKTYRLNQLHPNEPWALFRMIHPEVPATDFFASLRKVSEQQNAKITTMPKF